MWEGRGKTGPKAGNQDMNEPQGGTTDSHGDEAESMGRWELGSEGGADAWELGSRAGKGGGFGRRVGVAGR